MGETRPTTSISSYRVLVPILANHGEMRHKRPGTEEELLFLGRRAKRKVAAEEIPSF